MGGEIHRRQQHEDDQYGFDGGRIEINDAGVDSNGNYVLYWMQAAQRICDNHALEFAIRMANKLNCALVVAFVIMPNFPHANLRHFTFMLQGIAQLQEDFKARGIGFVIRIGKPAVEILKLAKDAKSVWRVQELG